MSRFHKVLCYHLPATGYVACLSKVVAMQRPVMEPLQEAQDARINFERLRGKRMKNCSSHSSASKLTNDRPRQIDKTIITEALAWG